MKLLGLGALVLATTLGGDLPPGGTFFDDDGSAHEGQIEALASREILLGCDAQLGDLVCPDRALTRGQMAALLDRALDLPPATHDHFSDDQGSTFSGSINRIAEAGITTGCNPPDNDHFCPGDAVTRGQMAAFLGRAFDLPRASRDHFVDDNGSVFEDYINRLAEAGITTGCDSPTDDQFCPRHPVNRAQTASLLGRALGLSPLNPPPRPSFTLAVTGDLLIHSPVSSQAAANGANSGQAYDFRPMFSEVTPYLAAADLALCHLEVPLSADNTDLSGYPLFNAPRHVAQAIAAAGYEGCSTASNHSIDQGFAGVVSTLDVLDGYGLGHTGTARSQQEAATTRLYQVGEATVGHLSYTYGLNGLPLPADAPWAVNLIDTDEIIAAAERTRAAGAELVMVSLHWGIEYNVPPTAYQVEMQLDLAARLLASEAIDLIAGHHAHVVQPIGQIGEEFVIYGLGNFLSNQCCTSQQDGVIVQIEVAQRTADWWAVRAIDFLPTWVNRGGGYVILPVGAVLSSGTHQDLRSTLEASWDRTVRAIRSLDVPGLEPH